MTDPFANWLDEESVEELSEAEANDLIVEIVNRTREHPSLRRGAGAKGTIALKEVSMGFADISGKKLNRRAIEKAALVTLPHRVAVKPGTESSPEDIIKSLTRKVLYASLLKKKLSLDKMVRLSEEETQKVLQGLLETDMSLHDEEVGWDPNDMEFALMSLRNPEALEVFMNALEGMPQDEMDFFSELCKDLEDQGLLEMTEPYRYVFTKEAVEELSKVLKERFEQGEITKEEYERAIERLKQMLELGKKKYKLPEDEIPVVLADIMDVQDKFAAPVDSEDMYVHYLLKENRGEEVDSEKADYREIQVLIHNLFKKGLVKGAGTGTGVRRSFFLTETAFAWLLDDMIKRIYRKGWAKAASIKARADSERVDIRRFRPGDMFRDISVRQTFRQLVKQQKKLGDVRKSDFKSFVRRPRSRLNIVLCIDVSHSMGEHSKIRFAKLAAATLASEGIEEGDKVGIVTFSNDSKVVMPLTDETSSISNSVMTLKAYQYTNIGDGIKCARELLLRGRDMNQRHIILLTDGEPTAASRGAVRNLSMDERRVIGEEYAVEEAKKTTPKDIKISVLFIAGGEEMGEKFAEKLAKMGGGSLYKVATAEDLPNSVLKVWQQAKSL